MYHIIRNEKRIEKLTLKRFSELGLAERSDLQEWIVKEPRVFNEDLLILQKEFAGFDGTDERLDLLALDKDGYLVLIENKTDDSGKDVVWQALKYASYCASLTKDQVVGIYQTYLEKYGLGGSAEEKIRDFLGASDLDEVTLNPGNEQRIILVASTFRKEVTSTVLWLLGHGILIQCFKMNIFEHNNDYFLVSEQIIPVPEIKDYAIGLANKEAGNKMASEKIKERERISLSFWTKALDELRKSQVKVYDALSPCKDAWMNAGSGITGVVYVLVLIKDEARCEISINVGNKDMNKKFFDRLEHHKDEIESSFGNNLIWARMDDKKSSIIRIKKYEDCYDEGKWPEIIQWMIENIGKMHDIFDGYLKNTYKNLTDKKKSITEQNTTDPDDQESRRQQ